MKNFKDGGFRKGGNSFGGKPKFGKSSFGGGDKGGKRQGAGFGKRTTGAPELFSAQCSTCRKNCEVPFRPSAGKPVYCSACFDQKNNDATREYHAGKSAHSTRSNFRDEARSSRESRPFRQEAQHGHGTGDLVRQLEKIESKLNKILEIINPPMPPQKKKVPTHISEEKVDTDMPLKKRLTKVVATKAPAKKVKKAVKTKS